MRSFIAKNTIGDGNVPHNLGQAKTSNDVTDILTKGRGKGNVSPRLHVEMTGHEIKNARIITTSWNDSAQVATSSIISLVKLLPEINDEELKSTFQNYFCSNDEMSISDDLTTQQDSYYMEAVKDGDMETNNALSIRGLKMAES